jgi:hypothetical protein
MPIIIGIICIGIQFKKSEVSKSVSLTSCWVADCTNSYMDVPSPPFYCDVPPPPPPPLRCSSSRYLFAVQSTNMYELDYLFWVCRPWYWHYWHHWSWRVDDMWTIVWKSCTTFLHMKQPASVSDVAMHMHLLAPRFIGGVHWISIEWRYLRHSHSKCFLLWCVRNISSLKEFCLRTAVFI